MQKLDDGDQARVGHADIIRDENRSEVAQDHYDQGCQELVVPLDGNQLKSQDRRSYCNKCLDNLKYSEYKFGSLPNNILKYL